jgi:serine/threonine-protein kinase
MAKSDTHDPAPGESSGVIKIPSLAQEADPASLSGRFQKLSDEDDTIEDMSGRVLGAYRLLRPLGGRGLTTVYEARLQSGTDKRLALKVLRNANFNAAALDVVQRRFVQEARIAARLHHPHICDVVDFGIADGLAYMAMEYLEGESLRETLRRHGPLPWTRVLPMFLHICDALEAAHAQGVIHRDLKPSNCFRVRHATGDDFIKVVDFGLARIVDEDLPEGLLAGGVLLSTPEYMAPELIRGAKPDPRVDIYGVGVLLYELLTGTCPFKSEKQTTVLAMQLLDAAVPPRRVAPDANIPGVVERVILKALSKAPEERFQNIMEMRVALLDDTRMMKVDPASSGTARRRAITHAGSARSMSGAAIPRDSSVGVTIVLGLIAAGLVGWVLAGTPGLSMLTGNPPVAPQPQPQPQPQPVVAPPVARPDGATPPEGPPSEAEPETPPEGPVPDARAADTSAPPAEQPARPSKTDGTGPKEQINFDIVEDPSAPTEIAPQQIDELLRPYRPAASQCGKQNGLAVATAVELKFMVTADGKLANIRPVGRPADDPTALCMIDVIRDAKLAVPAGSKFKHAFFDYAFTIY